MKRLILLTLSYPFKPDDIFLESEQAYFPKDIPVDAIPSGYEPCKTEKADDIPDNVSFLPLVWKRIPPLVHAYYMAASLFRKDVRRDLFSLRREKKVGPHQIISSLSWIARGEWLFRKVEKHYRRELSEHPEQLVFYSFWLLIPAYAAARLRGKYGCHAVARGHGGDIFEERSILGRLPMREYTLKNLDFVSICSGNGQRYLIDKYHAGDIRQTYLGCEYHGTRTVSAPSPDKPFVVASCGSVIPLKRIDLIARALSLIEDRKIEWVHFGDGNEFQKLERLAGTLPDNVTAKLMGMVSHDSLIEYYSQNDIHLFISASTTEGIPVSIMEALSFGMPILATDAGGSREAITERHGRLLPVDITPEDLAEGIRYFISLPWEEYLGMRSEARRFWEKNFWAEKNYKEFYELLEKL